MDKDFRLYNSLKSSYFDLISGDKETQQTKGLGVLLSKSDTALKLFFELPKIKSKVGRIDFNRVNRLIVNCELISQTNEKFRADIILRLYIKDKSFKAILIEAKSINKGTSVYETNKQIERYIVKQSFKELIEFGNEVYGITLTKYPSFSEHKSLISITWTDLIETFYKHVSKSDGLLKDYFNFLTQINGAMKFYEREVFSIPTVKWSMDAINKFHIYECPNSGKYLIKYKPLYLAFRNSGGGEMERLYKVDQIIILNFKNDLETFMDDTNYDIDARNNIRQYSEFMLSNSKWNKLPDDEKQVFVLSKNSIELKNKPRPKRNNSFRAYYELADLMNKEIID